MLFTGWIFVAVFLLIRNLKFCHGASSKCTIIYLLSFYDYIIQSSGLRCDLRNGFEKQLFLKIAVFFSNKSARHCYGSLQCVFRGIGSN